MEFKPIPKDLVSDNLQQVKENEQLRTVDLIDFKTDIFWDLESLGNELTRIGE